MPTSVRSIEQPPGHRPPEVHLPLSRGAGVTVVSYLP